MRRPILFILGGLGVLAFVYLVGGKLQSTRGQRELQAELDAAWKEGLPTNAEQMRSLVPPAKPSENAAPLLRKLPKPSSGKAMSLEYELMNGSSVTAERDVEQFLRQNKQTLDLVDQAAQLPKCWFDLRWEDGMALLLPEYARVRGASRILLLRGTLEAKRGQVRAALKDANTAFVLARLIRQEPTYVASVVACSIERNTVLHVAQWAYVHPESNQYLVAFERLRNSRSTEPDPRVVACDCFQLFCLIDICSTDDGLRKLGYKKEDVDSLSRLRFASTLFATPRETRIAILKSFRHQMAICRSPGTTRRKGLAEARQMICDAMKSDAVAYSVYEALGYSDGWNDASDLAAADRVLFEGLSRALWEPKLPNTIKTSDLLSPFDNKPLSYEFDGTRCTLTVSGLDVESVAKLVFPPEPPKVSKNKL